MIPCPTLKSCIKACTSYSLKPTTIPLAPPLVEVNGEVLKTLADRTVPFCTDGRSLYRPRRYLPHLSWAISLSGWVGWALKNLPPFSRGLYPKRQRLKPCVSRQVCVEHIGTTVPTKTPSMFLLQDGNIASTHYRTSSLVTSTCTSYSLKPTTIPLAPPLVEVNGEVLKTLADRTVPFCTDGRSLYRPKRYLPHLSWAISLAQPTGATRGLACGSSRPSLKVLPAQPYASLARRKSCPRNSTAYRARATSYPPPLGELETPGQNYRTSRS